MFRHARAKENDARTGLRSAVRMVPNHRPGDAIPFILQMHRMGYESRGLSCAWGCDGWGEVAAAPVELGLSLSSPKPRFLNVSGAIRFLDETS